MCFSSLKKKDYLWLFLIYLVMFVCLCLVLVVIVITAYFVTFSGGGSNGDSGSIKMKNDMRIVYNHKPFDKFNVSDYHVINELNITTFIVGWSNNLHDILANFTNLTFIIAVHNFLEINKAIEFAKSHNQVVGYYTFDEPALHNVNASYQEYIYNYIRKWDNDTVSRPIYMAQTAWSLSLDELSRGFSLNAFDILLVDHYTSDIHKLTEMYYNIDYLGGLSKGFIIVFPAYNTRFCKPTTCKVYKATKEVFDILKLDKYVIRNAVGFYVFGYNNNEGYSINNCEEIYKEVSQISFPLI